MGKYAPIGTIKKDNHELFIRLVAYFWMVTLLRSHPCPGMMAAYHRCCSSRGWKGIVEQEEVFYSLHKDHGRYMGWRMR